MMKIYVTRDCDLPQDEGIGPKPSFRPAGFRKPYLTLAEEHWARIKSCSRQEDRRRRLMGCLLTADAFYEYLSQYNGGTEEVRLEAFALAENGKPALFGIEGFHFNISHSGGYAVCAAADSGVGVDIQQKRPVSEKIAERFFSAAEQEVLSRVTGKEWEDLFFRLWSAKEAYMKYTGKGIKQGMHTFTADLEGKVIRDEAAGTKIPLTQIRLPENRLYRLSVCCQEREYELCHRKFTAL